jgi:uncharacterized protein (DUF2062 family)
MIGSSGTRRWLDQLLHTHDTPKRTALAYAVGVFFGFSPFLGLHTVLGLVVAFALNLNRVSHAWRTRTRRRSCWYYTLARCSAQRSLRTSRGSEGFARSAARGEFEASSRRSHRSWVYA